MAQLVGKRCESPDETRNFTDETGRIELVDLNGNAVGLGDVRAGLALVAHNLKPAGGDRLLPSRTRRRPAWPDGAENGRRDPPIGKLRRPARQTPA
jgi:hypothetical protein